MQNQIKDYFTDSIQTQIIIAETLSVPIQNATSMILQRLLDGKQIFICGTGLSSLLSTQFQMHFFQRLELDQLTIPIYSLNADMMLIQMLSQSDPITCYSKQLNQMGQSGDLLILISSNNEAPELKNLVQAAKSKDIEIIALTGEKNCEIQSDLGDNNLNITIPVSDASTLFEMQSLVLHCMRRLIEQQLFF